MSSNALNAQGTQLLRGDGATTQVFTAVAEITGHSWAKSLKVNEVSHYGSTVVDKQPGKLLDPGSMTFPLHLLPGDMQQAGIEADQAGKVIRDWKVVLPNAVKTYAFSGFVTNWKEDGAVDGILTAEVTIELTTTVTKS